MKSFSSIVKLGAFIIQVILKVARHAAAARPGVTVEDSEGGPGGRDSEFGNQVVARGT